MNVSISTKDVPTEHGTTNVRRVLVAERDFSVGDVIYKESAAVAALDPDLISKGTHCSHCLRKIVPVPGTLLTHPNGTLPTAYCSVECQTSSSQTYYNLLFTREPFVSEMSKETNTPENLKKRISAQEAFAAFLTNTKDQGTQMTHLVAQFTAIYLTAELNRVLGIKFAPPDESSINDHFERLRYVDPDREIIGDAFGLVRGVLDAAVANNIEFLSEERFGILVGKMGYNAVGICYEGGRDDKPKNQEPGIERTRTPYGFERQIGSGIYMTSSYLTHSCAPNTRISFADGTSTLTLIASREIKSGDELTMSYVDVSQKDGETVIDARRRRRKQLALGWKFACRCVRCGDEQPASERDGKERYHDESKEEEVVRRYEQGMAGKGEAMVD